MAATMTIEELNSWIGSLPNIGKWGWKPQMNKIGAQIKKVTRGNLLRHLAPDGTAWKTRYAQPRPKKGDLAPVAQDTVLGPSVFTQCIKTRRGQIAAIMTMKEDGYRPGHYPKLGDMAPMRIIVPQKRTLKIRLQTKDDVRAAVNYREIYGPPFKALPAVVRTSGKHKARKILDFLTGSGYMGRALRTSKSGLEYGFTKGSRWIEELHFGGRSAKYKATIPPRLILGMTPALMDFAVKTIGDKLEKYLGQRSLR